MIDNKLDEINIQIDMIKKKNKYPSENKTEK